MEYVQGKAKPNVDCIICALRHNDEKVKILKVYQDDIIFVVLNIYPYNPGHLMVCLNKIHHQRWASMAKKGQVGPLAR